MFGIIYLLLLYISGSRSTVLTFPFLGSIDIGILYYPFALFAILALSNAVNFTDGLDGLLSSVTFVVGIAYMIITSILQMWEMGIMAAAMAGGCLGFLIWNFYPAKVFMGDTGSLFLGGLIIALAFGTGLPVYIVLIGLIYVVEAASVVIQMTYFKLTHGKRIFKMSPIHHHFELCGYSEVQIVVGLHAGDSGGFCAGYLGGAAAVNCCRILDFVKEVTPHCPCCLATKNARNTPRAVWI